jgi:hypothetical protein
MARGNFPLTLAACITEVSETRSVLLDRFAGKLLAGRSLVGARLTHAASFWNLCASSRIERLLKRT